MLPAAHPIAKAFEEYRAGFRRPEGTMEWSKTTIIGARTLQGTCPGGPNIRAVIRRRTIRLSDNALIDDADINAPNCSDGFPGLWILGQISIICLASVASITQSSHGW